MKYVCDIALNLGIPMIYMYYSRFLKIRLMKCVHLIANILGTDVTIVLVQLSLQRAFVQHVAHSLL